MFVCCLEEGGGVKGSLRTPLNTCNNIVLIILSYSQKGKRKTKSIKIAFFFYFLPFSSSLIQSYVMGRWGSGGTHSISCVLCSKSIYRGPLENSQYKKPHLGIIGVVVVRKSHVFTYFDVKSNHFFISISTRISFGYKLSYVVYYSA